MKTSSSLVARAAVRTPARSSRGCLRAFIVPSLLACIAAAGATNATAQSIPARDSVPRRVHVRITAPDLELRRAVGWVDDIHSDTLRVQLDPTRTTMAVPRSRITEMEVSDGHRRHVLRAVGIGAGTGAGLGIVVGLASGDDPPGWLSLSAGDKAVVLGTTGAIVGTVVGLVVGLASPGERWVPMQSPGAVSLRVAPVRRDRGTGLYAGVVIRLR